jgi:hypothetical protein
MNGGAGVRCSADDRQGYSSSTGTTMTRFEAPVRRGGLYRNGLRPLPTLGDAAEPTRAKGKKMTAEQGEDARTGGVPALNIERIYRTTVPADDLARALADHFRAQEFEAQVFRTSGDRTVMQARKESLWRHLLGVAYALTVVFTPGEGHLSVGLGGHEWVDTAISGAIGLAVQPVLLGTAYGVWKENQLDKEVWQVIDERVGAPAEAIP